ncbi:DUF2147 domain-containing protein [Pinisolibacter aquiterrae]|uniref:DUF2147 domain-containing protein n=1 Tax=Pinisolibacter aquiterrae TaxID=2815579 RepID=UPI001C3DFDFC|nr:DUF2147 domain-containing protein [Pinisolibacter aquiterrae]MBV5263854.1 DUF2147 domain-containing protein [Pinisolibacter aquiterrae]MCC8237247.1 DUF2147 domain-containing protein [Pinisolibacter aquiterrae]
MNTRHAHAAIAAATAAVLLAPPLGFAAAEPSPFGLWARGDGNARVRIARCGSDICAVNTWIREGTKGEKTGDKLVMTVEPAGAGRWTGTAFDPQRDLSYRLTMTVGAASMTTRGCIVVGLLCKEMGWTRLGGD